MATDNDKTGDKDIDVFLEVEKHETIGVLEVFSVNEEKNTEQGK